jgi:hypothetical protein
MEVKQDGIALASKRFVEPPVFSTSAQSPMRSSSMERKALGLKVANPDK